MTRCTNRRLSDFKIRRIPDARKKVILRCLFLLSHVIFSLLRFHLPASPPGHVDRSGLQIVRYSYQNLGNEQGALFVAEKSSLVAYAPTMS
jgi:hypothetical protein